MSEKEATYAIATVERGTMIQAARDRYNIMVEYVKSMMTEGKDFGKIPGSDKPTLYKPGAEKLNSLFELYPELVISDKLTDWQTGMFFYQYRCVLRHRRTGEEWGSGLGSCNSLESKYRYRYVATDKKPSKAEAEILKAKGIGKWRKQDSGWVWMERIENDQVFDLVNTIDKMAQKRAFVAASLIACNASEFFTQDIEDLGYVEGEYKEMPAQPATIPAEPEQPADGNHPAKTDDKAQGEFNGRTPIYQAVVDAKLSDNLFAAKKALEGCSTGYDTPEKAVAWMRPYRAWRDSGADSKTAAAHANKGELPK